MARIKRPPWDRRWLIIRLTLGWCAIAATYLIAFAPSDALRENAFVAIAGLAASVILGYCGFAAWDDRNFMKAISAGSDDETETTTSYVYRPKRHREPEE